MVRKLSITPQDDIMKIETKDDWFMVAERTIPLLSNYVERFTSIERYSLLAELYKALSNKDWRTLCRKFYDIWQEVPNNPDAYVSPFFDLCALCSNVDIFFEECKEEEELDDLSDIIEALFYFNVDVPF